jgi:hypothetical protein
LSYDKQGAEGCPDEAALREQVAERLGYDPFREGARRKVSVTIAPKPGGLHARIRTVDPSAESGGAFERDIDGEAGQCEELAKSVVLAVSLAIDPMSFARRPTGVVAAPPVPTPASPSSAPAAATEPATQSPTEPRPAEDGAGASSSPSEPWRVGVSGLLRTGFGLVPAPSLGPVVAIHYGPKLWALRLEGSADFPTGATLPAGAGSGVEATLLRAGLGLCVRPIWLVGCARVDLGGLVSSGTSVAQGTPGTTFYADAAVFAGARVVVTSRVGAVLGGDLVVPLNPTKLFLSGFTPPAWSTPSVAGSLDLGVDYVF